jgi:hypothetical protein
MMVHFGGCKIIISLLVPVRPGPMGRSIIPSFHQLRAGITPVEGIANAATV